MSERRVLPIIIFSQFAGTSLWFAGNAILPDLRAEWGIPESALGPITSAVQLGFILGTLAFAFFAVADRYPPRAIFFVSCLCGALLAAATVVIPHAIPPLLLLRFATGVCLAGIYPVGMKIAAGWYRQGLGHALGFLVGALVLGTAFPHLLRAVGARLSWEFVMLGIAALALTGGAAMLLLRDGPYLVNGAPFDPSAIRLLFENPELRRAALGYFGHMWELYAFYAFVPLYLAANGSADVPLRTFAVIGAGSIGCAAGGIISRRAGSARVAWIQLLVSCTLCILSPLVAALPPWGFLPLMLVWGTTVVGDSPQFSALVARAAPADRVGSALTITTSIGFGITIASIEMLAFLARTVPPAFLLLALAPGPIAGLLLSAPLLREHEPT